jgi:hypothetical protein
MKQNESNNLDFYKRERTPIEEKEGVGIQDNVPAVIYKKKGARIQDNKVDANFSFFPVYFARSVIP